MLNLIKKAEEHCLRHGLKLTDPRKKVLRILMGAQKPLGAYDILKQLEQYQESPKPPTVYRAIQFWCEEGFVHCIDSLKAYVACPQGNHIGEAHFFICLDCGNVSEDDAGINMVELKANAEKRDFVIKNCTTEIKGVCSDCG